MSKNTLISRITSGFFVNSSRKYLRDFAAEAAKSVPDGSIVLDAGAGDCIYKELFSEMNYESADFCQVEKPYAEITHVCDLSNIPVGDNRYDLILCSQVLEHLPAPNKVLKELNRVLKPDGELWLSAPFYYEEHEKPYDFYRYTQFGFKELLTKAGFTIEKIDWLEGYFGTLSYQFKTMAISLPLSPSNYKGFFFKLSGPILAFILKIGALFLSFYFGKADLKKKHTDSGYCKNYCLVAKISDKNETDQV
jgi:SAM-dependent methyltransferase